MISSTDRTAAATDPIPFLDLTAQHRQLEHELVDTFRQALRSAAFVGGSEVAAFETEFATFVTARGCVGVNSGTDALRFACLAMGVRPGDEVITVPHTFIATTEAISQAGGAFRFVDIDAATMTMDPQALAAAVTPRTVGVVPVHLYGQSADMLPILAVAKRHGLWVVEDAAQAHGAEYRGRRVGTWGALAAFSFYPGKNLGSCGEGGAVTGGDSARLETVRRLRDHGQSRKYYHDTEGYNGRLHAIQAGFLRVKLRHLERWNERRRRIAQLYRDSLAEVSEVELPVEAAYARHAYHLFVVRVEARGALQEHLAKNGIGTGLHYPIPLHRQAAYAHRRTPAGVFPVTERVATRVLSLPMFPELSDDQACRVADNIRRFYR